MPHDIAPAAQRRKIVVVGTGPAGLEAARVAAARGHDVVVFEAADKPGGQIRLTALSKRRQEMIGIIDWRYDQCIDAGVSFQFNVLADVDHVLAERPEVVIIATGGLPDCNILQSGNDLVVSAWDIIAGSVKPGTNILLFDDAGDHAALQAAEILAASGASVEIMTPDRSFAPEVMAMNLVPYMRTLQRANIRFTVTYRLFAVVRENNALKAVVGSDYGTPLQERLIDQVVVNHGTLPLDDLYFALKPQSANNGVVDYDRLIAGLPQPVRPAVGFELYRIGDAVAARNTHAAIYDALRIARHL